MVANHCRRCQFACAQCPLENRTGNCVQASPLMSRHSPVAVSAAALPACNKNFPVLIAGNSSKKSRDSGGSCSGEERFAPNSPYLPGDQGIPPVETSSLQPPSTATQSRVFRLSQGNSPKRPEEARNGPQLAVILSHSTPESAFCGRKPRLPPVCTENLIRIDWLSESPERPRRVGSIRRECVDHLVVLSEAHLRRVLRAYDHYYNEIRTHWSLAKDAPVSRPVQRTGTIRSGPILGGLHHHSPHPAKAPRSLPRSATRPVPPSFPRERMAEFSMRTPIIAGSIYQAKKSLDGLRRRSWCTLPVAFSVSHQNYRAATLSPPGG